MRTRPTVTVQAHGAPPSFSTERPSAMIRLRGKWVKEIFPPGTRLTVTREERKGKLVLVLETETRQP
jgi:hypothetical protein